MWGHRFSSQSIQWNVSEKHCLLECHDCGLLLKWMVSRSSTSFSNDVWWGHVTRSIDLSALKASVGSGDPKHGQQIHSHLIKAGFLTSIRVGNALISMYAKLSNLEDAETMYRNMVEQDVVSWNSIITANAQNGCNYWALTLFVEMKKEGLSADEFTFGGVLKKRDLMEVKKLHAQIKSSKASWRTMSLLGALF